MKIASFEDSDRDAMETAGTLQTFLDDGVNYSAVPFKDKLKPSSSWAIPFVTGHKYRVHWAEGLDFTQMKVELSEPWTTSDLGVEFNMNFTEVREAVNFTYDYGAGE